MSAKKTKKSLKKEKPGKQQVSAKPEPVKTKKVTEKKSGDNKVTRYFKEVRYEVKKITWPTRPEIVASTLVVIVVVILFTTYVGLLDLLFIQLVKLFTNIKG